jgi:pimeloyl-ACP methyl ester carboxylesterase
MSSEQKAELEIALKKLGDSAFQDKDTVFTQLGRLASKVDSYEPMSEESTEARYDIFKHVWSETELLRSRGGFVEAVKNIRCPVLAIHGDHDPHPVDGIRSLLASTLKDFRLILLEKCGHYPWIERYANGELYAVLKKEISGFNTCN